ncbi:hypothetical protein HS088_TW20G00435 [Tripterygium wilfordii]|uniref:UDP-glycosyltransferases domain-containing protein n=1 Tax=Tripterygium wilfordii TaxID=458696 RepID=A0A7J7C800_TRIWF|nr:hypothetical protein HS088_TW20G00435 [Tripterygium wilfordii]
MQRILASLEIYPNRFIFPGVCRFGVLNRVCSQYPLAAGILVNSSLDIEPGAFKALMEVKPGFPPIYPIGPLTQPGKSSSVDDRSGCLEWLDNQPNGSVLFVNFGSGGTLSIDQINELAFGLEMSGQRFLWVVRPPNDNVNAAYFEANGADEDPSEFLPNGFLDRTRDVGLVVLNWAPQIEVMAHGSTGGFLTHCGWNSILEAIVNGVPLIAWPLYAEQKMNAVLLADDLNVAIRVQIGADGLVGRDDIAKYVKGLMAGEEGKILRSKMGNLKDGASRALSQEGFSTKSLAQVAEIWKNQKK